MAPPPTVFNLPAGSYAFSAPHDYTTDPASGSYTIGVTLSDACGKTAFAQTTVAISNPAPVFASPGLVLSSSSIVEKGTVSVSGTIVSPGGIDTNTVSLDWGDGSTPTTIVLPPGDDTFSTTHTYLNNPPGVASESYTIDRLGDQRGWQGRLRVDERHRQQRRPAVHRGRPDPVGADRQRG